MNDYYPINSSIMKKLVPVIFSLLIPFGSLSAQLTANISDSSNISCNAAVDGTATVYISGGTEPYEILWDDDYAVANQAEQKHCKEQPGWPAG